MTTEHHFLGTENEHSQDERKYLRPKQGTEMVFFLKEL